MRSVQHFTHAGRITTFLVASLFNDTNATHNHDVALVRVVEYEQLAHVRFRGCGGRHDAQISAHEEVGPYCEWKNAVLGLVAVRHCTVCGRHTHLLPHLEGLRDAAPILDQHFTNLGLRECTQNTYKRHVAAARRGVRLLRILHRCHLQT